MASEAKNLKLVAQHLEPGEKILAHTFGYYERGDWGRNGVLVATDKRLVFFGKKLFGFDLEVFPNANVSSIDVSKGFLGHSVKVFASGNTVEVKFIKHPAGAVAQFIATVRDQIGKGPALSVSRDVPGEIRELAKLHADGILTEQEFSSKKAELLSKM